MHCLEIPQAGNQLSFVLHELVFLGCHCIQCIALFSAKMENDFLCMVLIVWLVVQIICLLNIGRN